MLNDKTQNSKCKIKTLTTLNALPFPAMPFHVLHVHYMKRKKNRCRRCLLHPFHSQFYALRVTLALAGCLKNSRITGHKNLFYPLLVQLWLFLIGCFGLLDISWYSITRWENIWPQILRNGHKIYQIGRKIYQQFIFQGLLKSARVWIFGIQIYQNLANLNSASLICEPLINMGV
jgi:hypothetical protein